MNKWLSRWYCQTGDAGMGIGTPIFALIFIDRNSRAREAIGWGFKAQFLWWKWQRMDRSGIVEYRFDRLLTGGNL
jgi:hypothetical protein